MFVFFLLSRMSRLNYAFAQNPKVFWCSDDDDGMEWLSSFNAYDLDILSLELGKKMLAGFILITISL